MNVPDWGFTGLLISLAVALIGGATALLRISSTLESMRESVQCLPRIEASLGQVKDVTGNLNTNMLLMIQQISLEARRSRDDVIVAVRDAAKENTK